MKREFLISVLFIARWTGMFAVSRWLTRRDLRILCYHGASISDEGDFRPSVFMTAETFSARMQFLRRAGYKVLPLEEALERLERNLLSSASTVITIDDGWYGTYRHQVPALVAHNYPATLYVATYYLVNQFQVFNVALQYIVWKIGIRELDLSKLDLGFESSIANRGIVDANELCNLLVDAADALDGAMARQALLRRFCDEVGFDWHIMERLRQFTFMSEAEAKEVVAQGIDLQLHTHRHRFPDTDIDDANREIRENREILERIVGSARRHFCYPSGEYTQQSLGYLASMHIDSATTTNPGFNRAGCSRLELKRFLDSESFSELEFDAEMSGFFELIRRLRNRV